MLIRNPRALVADIIKELARLGWHDPTGLRKSDLQQGALSEVMRFRLDLTPRRSAERDAGTCFVNVKLRSKGEVEYQEFENALNDVVGVVEWDQVSGTSRDYIVRLVGSQGDTVPKRISEVIGKIENVQEAYFSDEMQIWSSGVVDNFEPDHFLNIQPDPSYLGTKDTVTTKR